MATVSKELRPTTASLPASNAAALNFVAGTNFTVESLAFDGGSTDESAFFAFYANDYGSGNLTLKIQWEADTASSGDVVWGAQLAAITPNTDTQDIETKAFATAQTVTDSHLGTTNQRLHEVDLTISNLDSLASGDWCMLRFYRNASSGSDTMTGDALVTMLVLSYSDT